VYSIVSIQSPNRASPVKPIKYRESLVAAQVPQGISAWPA